MRKTLSLCLSIIFFQNLQPTPVYESCWTNSKQEIRLYEDNLETHLKTNNQDILLADQFFENIKTISQDSIFLLEQINDQQLNDNALYTQHVKIDENSAFLPLVHKKLKESGLNEQIKMVDINHYLRFIHIINLYSCYLQEASDEASLKLFPVAIDYQTPGILEKPFFEILQDAIDQLETLTAQCCHKQIQKILCEKTPTMILRKFFIQETLKQNLLMNQEAQCLLSINTILEKVSFKNFKQNRTEYEIYAKFCSLFSFHMTPFLDYFNDLIPAQILYEIAECEINRSKNIVIVAQDDHTEKLERYLLQLGYKQTYGLGFEQRYAKNQRRNEYYEQLVNSKENLQNLLDTSGVFGVKMHVLLNQIQC